MDNTKLIKKQLYNKKYYEKKKNKKVNVPNSGNEINTKKHPPIHITEENNENIEKFCIKNDYNNENENVKIDKETKKDYEHELNIIKLYSDDEEILNTIKLYSNDEENINSIELYSDDEEKMETIELYSDYEENTNQENIKQEITNQNNTNQENTNQENTNQENTNQENTNQENINQENMNQENTNKENTNKENINQENINQEKKKYIDTVVNFYKNNNYTKKIENIKYDTTNNISDYPLKTIINAKNDPEFKIINIDFINEIVKYLIIIQATTQDNPFIFNYQDNNIVTFLITNTITIINSKTITKEILDLINKDRKIIKMLSSYEIIILDETNKYNIKHILYKINNINIMNYKHKNLDLDNINNEKYFNANYFCDLIINTLKNNNEIFAIYLDEGEIFYYQINDTIFINNYNAIKNNNLLDVFNLLIIKNNKYIIEYSTNNYHCLIQKNEIIEKHDNKLSASTIKTYEDKLIQLKNANIIIDKNIEVDEIEKILKKKYKNNTIHLFLNAILHKIKNDNEIPESTINKLKDKIKSYCDINAQERGENKNNNLIKWEEVLSIHTKLKNSLKTYKDVFNFTLLSVYIYIPPRRLDYGNVLITDSREKCNDINKNYYVSTSQQFIFCNYKTSKIKSRDNISYKHIEQDFNLPPILIEILNNYINYPGKEKKIGDFLFSCKNNNKISMSKRTCYNKLRKILGNRPVQSARSSFVTFKHEINKTTNEILKDSDMMSHKLGTHMTYSKHN